MFRPRAFTFGKLLDLVVGNQATMLLRMFVWCCMGLVHFVVVGFCKFVTGNLPKVCPVVSMQARCKLDASHGAFFRRITLPQVL